jgi:hypothetical protein
MAYRGTIFLPIRIAPPWLTVRLRINSNPNRLRKPAASFFLELFDANVGQDVHRRPK